jgi:CubicO group peptidase (beta-lactamase class C family)
VENAPNCVRHAIDAPLITEPGTHWAYNNNATNLLAEIVRRASSEPLDLYLARRLFQPLGIHSFEWKRDPSGNVYGMYGLRLLATDLARVGQLLLEGGVWKGRPLISREWLEASVLRASMPSEPQCGLLWWRVQYGEAFLAQGVFGQFLFVHPRSRLVIVRLRQVDDRAAESRENGFEDFVERSLGLARRGLQR